MADKSEIGGERETIREMNLLQIKEMVGGREVVRMKFPGPSGVDVVIMPPSPRQSPPPPPSYLLPTIKQKPEDLDVSVGSDAQFEIVVEDNTDVFVSWFKGTTLMLSSGRTKIWNIGNSFFMKISNVMESDEALYEFKVRNKIGDVGGDVQLLINDDDDEDTDDDDDDVEKTPKKFKSKDITVPPVFLRRLKHEYTIMEGDRLVLEVETEGQPEVSWYYEGRKLKNCGSDFMNITSHKNIHMLVIEETVIDDEGFYECVAKYEDFEIITSADVLIEDKIAINDNTPELHFEMVITSEDSANQSDVSNEGDIIVNCIGVTSERNNDINGLDGKEEEVCVPPVYIVSEMYVDNSGPLTLSLNKGDSVEVLDKKHGDMWLVRDLRAKSRIGFVSPAMLTESIS